MVRKVRFSASERHYRCTEAVAPGLAWVATVATWMRNRVKAVASLKPFPYPIPEAGGCQEWLSEYRQ
jgi:hypothetical protein